MTPKEEALELINKMYDAMDIQDGDLWKSAKQCALIAVDEILNTIEQIFETFEERKYWNEVKNEIELL